MCEFGCGVGNSMFPLLKKFPNLFFIAFDFSKNAIECIRKNNEYLENQHRIQCIIIIIILY
jgi:methyltransferase-like protein 6